MSTFPGEAPAPVAGQLDLDGGELRHPTGDEQSYACCAKALVDTSSFCVCFFESVCPDHGRRHNGTHD